MKLWRKAAGALKDRNSIWAASLARRTAFRHPDLEAAIIKATSHDESSVDYRNTQRVFAWLRTSHTYLKPLVWALSTRMEKTRSWIVALKGLMLMHGVFCSKVSAVQKIGRLPFDLSNFTDHYSKPSKSWGYNAFVRVYFAFLDQRAALLCRDSPEKKIEGKERDESLMEIIRKLQKLQVLLDLLLQIKPLDRGMNVVLIMEAMVCVIIEIFDIYSRICNATAMVLLRIYAAGKIEATMALRVLQKAALQGEQLSLYFEFCKEIGVLNASEFPTVEKIPEEDIRDLERTINGVTEGTDYCDGQDKAMVIYENHAPDKRHQERKIVPTIVITDQWEVFDDDSKINGGVDSTPDDHLGRRTVKEEQLSIQPFEHGRNQDLPDLICF